MPFPVALQAALKCFLAAVTFMSAGVFIGQKFPDYLPAIGAPPAQPQVFVEPESQTSINWNTPTFSFINENATTSISHSAATSPTPPTPTLSAPSDQALVTYTPPQDEDPLAHHQPNPVLVVVIAAVVLSVLYKIYLEIVRWLRQPVPNLGLVLYIRDTTIAHADPVRWQPDDELQKALDLRIAQLASCLLAISYLGSLLGRVKSEHAAAYRRLKERLAEEKRSYGNLKGVLALTEGNLEKAREVVDRKTKAFVRPTMENILTYQHKREMQLEEAQKSDERQDYISSLEKQVECLTEGIHTQEHDFVQQRSRDQEKREKEENSIISNLRKQLADGETENARLNRQLSDAWDGAEQSSTALQTEIADLKKRLRACESAKEQSLQSRVQESMERQRAEKESATQVSELMKQIAEKDEELGTLRQEKHTAETMQPATPTGDIVLGTEDEGHGGQQHITPALHEYAEEGEHTDDVVKCDICHNAIAVPDPNEPGTCKTCDDLFNEIFEDGAALPTSFGEDQNPAVDHDMEEGENANGLLPVPAPPEESGNPANDHEMEDNTDGIPPPSIFSGQYQLPMNDDWMNDLDDDIPAPPSPPAEHEAPAENHEMEDSDDPEGILPPPREAQQPTASPVQPFGGAWPSQLNSSYPEIIKQGGSDQEQSDQPVEPTRADDSNVAPEHATPPATNQNSSDTPAATSTQTWCVNCNSWTDYPSVYEEWCRACYEGYQIDLAEGSAALSTPPEQAQHTTNQHNAVNQAREEGTQEEEVEKNFCCPKCKQPCDIIKDGMCTECGKKAQTGELDDWCFFCQKECDNLPAGGICEKCNGDNDEDLRRYEEEDSQLGDDVALSQELSDRVTEEEMLLGHESEEDDEEEPRVWETVYSSDEAVGTTTNAQTQDESQSENDDIEGEAEDSEDEKDEEGDEHKERVGISSGVGCKKESDSTTDDKDEPAMLFRCPKCQQPCADINNGMCTTCEQEAPSEEPELLYRCPKCQKPCTDINNGMCPTCEKQEKATSSQDRRDDDDSDYDSDEDEDDGDPFSGFSRHHEKVSRGSKIQQARNKRSASGKPDGGPEYQTNSQSRGTTSVEDFGAPPRGVCRLCGWNGELFDGKCVDWAPCSSH